MNLTKFHKTHEYLDEIGIPRLDKYSNNVIVDRIDFTTRK